MADETIVEVVKPEQVETDAPAPVAEVAAETATAPEPTRLSEVEVSTLLEAEKRLPVISRVRLAESAYINGEAVKAAITAELAYLKEALGSGQPFGLGGLPTQPKLSPAERARLAEEAQDRVNAKYLHGGK